MIMSHPQIFKPVIRRLLSLILFCCSLTACKKPEEEARVGNSILPGANEVPIEIAKPENKEAVVDSILDHVLVIENADSPTSMQIAKYYREKRGVKKSLRIHCQDSSIDASSETMTFAVFQEVIEKPLREYLSKDPKIDYIVLNKGIPLRLTSAPVGFGSGQPSLDSCVAALDYSSRSDVLRAVLRENDTKGTCYVNRFWNSAERFSHAQHGGYLVTRLDGYTAASAMALVDNALAGERSRPLGPILLDSMLLADPVDYSKVPLSPATDGMTEMKTIDEFAWGEWDVDLVAASAYLTKSGVPVEIDRTENFIGNRTGLMGYASWGSNDSKYDAGKYQSLRFAPGAIAETAVSTGARTFLPTSGGQSLIADLIEARVTGVKGYCDEPFLLAVASPTILFDRYTRGWNLAESFYAASRFVGWEDIVIGDPLSSPYANPKDSNR